jgi:chromosome segregation ATPase
MNQPSDLSADQRRSSELDARESYIVAREKMLDGFDAQKADYERQIGLLETTQSERQLLVDAQQARIKQLDGQYAITVAALQELDDKYGARLDNWRSKVETTRSELTSIKDSIKERQQYQKDQEVLIGKQAEEGNVQLKGLEYEIIEARQVIKDLKAERVNLYGEKKQLETDIDKAQLSFEPEVEAHLEVLRVLESQKPVIQSDIDEVNKHLKELRKEEAALLIKRQQIHDDVDAKLRILDEKERKIMVEREALRQEREDMQSERHYYQSPKSLYDLP